MNASVEIILPEAFFFARRLIRTGHKTLRCPSGKHALNLQNGT
jgi:hypothetical protein